jgi:hypothetical protein
MGVSGVARTVGQGKAGKKGQGQGKSRSRGRGTGRCGGLRLRLSQGWLAGWLLYSTFKGRQAGLEPGLVACEARADTSKPQ